MNSIRFGGLVVVISFFSCGGEVTEPAEAAELATWDAELVGDIDELLTELPPNHIFAAEGEHIANSYLVVLNAGSEPVAELAGELAATYGASVNDTFESAFRGFSASMSEFEAAELANDPRVKYLEEDGVAEPAAVQDLRPLTADRKPWGLDRIDQRALPLDGLYHYTSNAANVHAYIFDTGIKKDEPEFGGRATWDFFKCTGCTNAGDEQGHGSHIAGTIGAKTYGVAKNVHLHSVRVARLSFREADVLAGIEWVIKNHRKPAVANMSFALPKSPTLDAAVRRLIQAGVVVVVAAGNFSDSACNYSPGGVAEVITVGSSTISDAPYESTNVGACVDLFAPGKEIVSIAAGVRANGLPPGTPIKRSGTSMASPHVVGVAALYLAASPGASPATVRNAIVAAASPRMVGALRGSPNRLLFKAGW